MQNGVDIFRNDIINGIFSAICMVKMKPEDCSTFAQIFSVIYGWAWLGLIRAFSFSNFNHESISASPVNIPTSSIKYYGKDQSIPNETSLFIILYWFFSQYYALFMAGKFFMGNNV